MIETTNIAQVPFYAFESLGAWLNRVNRRTVLALVGAVAFFVGWSVALLATTATLLSANVKGVRK